MVIAQNIGEKIMKKFLKYIGNCIGYMVFKHKMKVAIFDAFNHGDEWITFVTKFATAYKDATPEDIRKDFIETLAVKIHEEGNKDK